MADVQRMNIKGEFPYFYAVKNLLATSLLQLLAIPLMAQINLAPNPGFEEPLKLRCRWIQSRSQFEKSLAQWTTATETHPDVISTKVEPNCWAHPKRQSKGLQLPHSGAFMVGLSTFGRGGKKDSDTPWHEYIEAPLKAPLLPGQKYYAEMWVLLPEIATKASNNLGILFSDTLINTGDRLPLCLQPQVNADKIISTKGGMWKKIWGVFEAKTAAKYLVIGNFYGFGQTQIKEIDKGPKGAYYYIDDILVRPAAPYEKLTPQPAACVPRKLVNVEKTATARLDLKKIQYTKGQHIVLSNIYFETAKAELLPESLEELKKLADILYDYPNMEIEINGHTDNVGGDDYNMQLSRNRAQAVADYLYKHKAEPERIRVNGYGKTRPVADNDTEAGRSQNRRVEFVILNM
ncbi:MAG: OmpA family protein [Flavobacteriales bacterium]